jgi:asparagine synthase (glutamine-hydrolysing)
MCGIFCLIKYLEKKYDVLSQEYIDIVTKLVTKSKESLDKINHRGPDGSIIYVPELCDDVRGSVVVIFGFVRLSIMDTSNNGMQPFVYDRNVVVCNGEIYNYKMFKNMFTNLVSNSDCEVILPAYSVLNDFESLIHDLDAEFSIILLDNIKNEIYACRDRYGVRPLYSLTDNNDKTIIFSSELKGLMNHFNENTSDDTCCNNIYQINPNVFTIVDLHRFNNLQYKKYFSYNNKIRHAVTDSLFIISENIKNKLINAVNKRLASDVPIGFLLSGGLDSSLIVAIAAKIIGPTNITCFTVGLANSYDVIASKKVVEYLGIPQQNHHIVPFTIEAGLDAIEKVIESVETYDITTIRASVPQYIMASYIKANTNIKVILSGEGSDEVHGSYKYMRWAPNKKKFNSERIRLIKELFYFDNKRTDRTMSAHSLEVRVPFLDFQYVEYALSLDPDLWIYKENYIEKKLLRDAFVGYLPTDILYRPKEAFSDAVSSSDTNWYKSIQNIAEGTTPDYTYIINPPQIDEAIYYRNIFTKYYKGMDHIIPHYWLPKFQNETIQDPSATIL